MTVQNLISLLSSYSPETNIMLKHETTIGNIELLDYDEEWDVLYIFME